MSLQKLLSGGGDREKSAPRIKDQEREDVKFLANFWRETYIKTLEEDYPVPPPEKALIKTLYSEYGKDKSRDLMEYYLNNFRTIDYIKGWPTIRALLGFRKSLIMDMVKGPRPLDGQAEEGGDYNIDGYFDD